MNLRHMEVFRAIYQVKSVSGAAHMLSVSQPSVSRMLHNFEYRLGYKLFRLRKGRVVPTNEADHLIKEIDDVFKTVERVERLARDLKEGARYRISVVSVFSLAAGILPSALGMIARRFPNIEISLDAQSLSDQIISVGESVADIGIALNVPQTPGMERRQLGKANFVAVIHKNHALAHKKVINLRDFCLWPSIISPLESPFGAHLYHEFRKQGLEPNVAVTVKSPLLSSEIISSFQSLGILDNLTARLLFNPDLLVKRLDKSFRIQIHAFWRANSPLSHPQFEFLKQLENQIGHLEEPNY